MIVISLPLVVFDQFLKYFFFSQDNFTLNRGIAFGLFEGVEIILILVCLSSLVIFFYIKNKQLTKIDRLALFTLIAGASSNLLDRLVYGGVIDYIEIGKLLSFNLADVMIISGGLIFLLNTLYKDVEINRKK